MFIQFSYCIANKQVTEKGENYRMNQFGEKKLVSFVIYISKINIKVFAEPANKVDRVIKLIRKGNL